MDRIVKQWESLLRGSKFAPNFDSDRFAAIEDQLTEDTVKEINTRIGHILDPTRTEKSKHHHFEIIKIKLNQIYKEEKGKR